MAKTLKEEQRFAIESDKKNIVVSASAGSGKTFVMINRIVRLLAENKADPENILCVTFTDSAASDMKAKLKKAVLKAVEDGNEPLGEIYNKISTMDIGTLHGFCSRLVRKYFFKAGVSPDFRVADNGESAELRERALNDAMRELYAQKDEGFYKLVESFKSHRSDGVLNETVLSAYEKCEQFGSDAVFDSYKENYTENGKRRFYAMLREMLLPVLNARIKRAEEAKRICREYNSQAGDKVCDAYILAIKNLFDGGAEYAFLHNDRETVPNVGRLDIKDGADKVREKLEAVKKETEELYEYLAKCRIDENEFTALYAISDAFLKTLRAFSERYAKEKEENGVLDFNDLEKYALTVLADEEIVKAVREKYKFVFVDEYQDINDIQEKIISLVSGENVFVVGDPKQSIYAFRGCNVKNFEQREKIAEEDGGAVRLNYSFRSAQSVIDAVNAIFDHCYTKDATGSNYKEFSRLKEGGVYPNDALGRAKLHLLLKDSARKKDKPNAEVYDIMKNICAEKEEETSDISKLLVDIINGELSEKYYDPDEKTYKRVKMNDIAILARGVTSGYVRKVVDGLAKHGVRVISDVKQNACDFPEIKVLINLLKLVDNFKQDIPLVGVLLSEIGGFSEEELLSVAYFERSEKPYRSFTESFYHYLESEKTDGDALKEKLVLFKRYFDGLRNAVEYKGAKGVLEKVAFDFDYEDILLAGENGDAKLRRYRKFLSETVKDGKSLTVKEFLNKIEKRKKVFECSEGGEEDAVSVVTMHSSKGLEYPVVIIIGLEKTFNIDWERANAFYDRDLGVFFNYFDKDKRIVSTTGYKEIVKAKLRSEAVKEEMRLLYVAATRAKYSLHLVMESSADPRIDREFGYDFVKTGKFSAYIPKSFPVTEERADEILTIGELTAKRRKVIIGKADDKKVAEMRKNFSFVYPYEGDTVLPIKNSVTSVLRENKEEYINAETPFYISDRYDTEDGGTDTERGMIAHRIMQYYDFSATDFEREIERLIQDGIITREEYALIDADRIKNAVSGEVFRTLSGKRLYREKDFIVNIPAKMIAQVNSEENILLQGVIDLLAVDNGGAVLIDYKYSRLKKDALKNVYKKQLELYAYAVEKSAQVKVKTKILVNLFTGETVVADD